MCLNEVMLSYQEMKHEAKSNSLNITITECQQNSYAFIK